MRYDAKRQNPVVPYTSVCRLLVEDSTSKSLTEVQLMIPLLRTSRPSAHDIATPSTCVHVDVNNIWMKPLQNNFSFTTQTATAL